MTGVDVTDDWPVAVYRKRPFEVQMVRWDGTESRARFLRSWTHGYFAVDDDTGASVYNDQENCPVAVPVGHQVARGTLGEFYPISPDALAATYESPAERGTRHDAETRLAGTRYDVGDDVDRVHADMTSAPRSTYRNLLKTTFGRAHLVDCATCQVAIAMLID